MWLQRARLLAWLCSVHVDFRQSVTHHSSPRLSRTHPRDPEEQATCHDDAGKPSLPHVTAWVTFFPATVRPLNAGRMWGRGNQQNNSIEKELILPLTHFY